MKPTDLQLSQINRYLWTLGLTMKDLAEYLRSPAADLEEGENAD